MQTMDSFPRIIVKRHPSNTNTQVFYIIISTSEVVSSTVFMSSYFRLVLTLLHANQKASLTFFS